MMRIIGYRKDTGTRVDLPYDYTGLSVRQNGNGYAVIGYFNSIEFRFADYHKRDYVDIEFDRLMNYYNDVNKDIVSPGPFYFVFRSEEEIIKEMNGEHDNMGSFNIHPESIPYHC